MSCSSASGRAWGSSRSSSCGAGRFPTLLRSTAQGLIFAVVRIALGLWSFLVPVLIESSGLHTVAWILTGFVLTSGLIGWFFAPSNGGKSLEEIQHERESAGAA